jgi:broad specificity phosphatase PhoE
MRLLLMRHGESVGNRAGRMAGHGADGLTERGRSQSQHLAQWLSTQWSPTAIYCSPLMRAVETLAQVLVGLGVPAASLEGTGAAESTVEVPWPTGGTVAVQYRAAIAEFQAGIFTGLTWPEARQRYPDLCDALETQRDWIPIPKAETPAAGRQRATAFVKELLHRHDDGAGIWVISHQWILEHLVAALLGCDRTWQIPTPNTGLFELWLDHARWSQAGMGRWTSDLWQIKRFGTCPHLEAIRKPQLSET